MIKTFIFRPLFVLTASLGLACLFALVVTLRYHGLRQHFLLYYFLPVSVPFVAFVFDRAARWRQISRWQWAIEVPIVLLALSRAFVSVPLVSGHALFLAYALLSSRSWVVRLTAVLVMLQVAYLKIFVWADPTLVGGIILGMVAAWIVSILARTRQPMRVNFLH